MPNAVPELDELDALIAAAGARLDVRVEARVDVDGRSLPVHALALGNPSPDVPAVGFFGGVHGLERIGAEVVLAWLRALVVRLRWDEQLHRLLETVRLVFMPLVNPGGLVRGTRANPNGVDLMRNAPLDALEPVPFLVGGQRVGAALPWYRGAAGAPMEAESAALCRVVERELLSREFGIAVDCHSGFGLRDRIWFPFARTREPIAHLAEIHALAALFHEPLHHYPYVIEPQSRQYLAHGDLWDYLYLRALDAGRTLLPLTLEMGSWRWVRKNPLQLFSRFGLFNPQIAHRRDRVLRRHLGCFDFLVRAAASQARWRPEGAARAGHRAQALARWYAGGGR